MDSSIKTREQRVRRQLARQGYLLRKSRADGCVRVKDAYQGQSLNDCGGYMILDGNTRAVCAGERFNLSLEDVERFAAE